MNKKLSLNKQAADSEEQTSDQLTTMKVPLESLTAD